ncbi:MAG: hypothetical protein JSW11_21320 [Candidatus Heimdallarchaeota archaeon]|nr:MAG: hypothetical protein JSW11_21320 [Candidatus Heimdallarchaeota archaeon]
MNTIQLGDILYDWYGEPEILSTPYYKIILTKPAKIMEITTDLPSTNGIVILGDIEAIVDSIMYTKSHGAVGNTTNFSGTNLVILGLSIANLESSLKKSDLPDEEDQKFKNQAEAIISKFKRRVEDPNMNISLDNEDDEFHHMIFGRRNFFLIGGIHSRKFVLIHKKQISIREGEYKLVQIDPVEGITIAKRDNVLNIGGTRNNLGSLVGEFGLNIASSVLEHLLWD